MSGTCASYDSSLGGYSFKVNFSSDSVNYMRVPILTFAVENTTDGTCNLMVNSISEGSSIIFGGLFFQEFYGKFTNSYTNTTAMDQSTTLYVGRNSIYSAYIGDEALTPGVNPFPVPPDSSSLLWLWITLGCVGGLLLIAVVGYLIYRNQNKEKTADTSNIDYQVTSQQEELKNE